MKSRAPIKLALIVAAALCILLSASLTWAQSQQTSSSPGDTQNAGQANVPPETPVRPNTDSYAVSLGTGQVISLSGAQPGSGNASSGESPASLAEYDDGFRIKSASNAFNKQFFYGTSVAGFYATGFDQTGNGQITSTTVSPYVGVLVPTKTGSYVIQYSSVIDPNVNGGVEAFHNLSLTAQGAFTRRLYWSIAGGGSYGSEAARAEGSLSYLVVGGIPTVNASSAAALFPADNVAFGNTDFSLTWLKSQREKISVSGFYTYSGIEGTHATPGAVGTHDNAVGSFLTYSRAYSENVTLRAYGDTAFTLNLPTCTTYGGGGGIDVKFKHDVVLDAQGGPQRNSGACGGQQNFNFNGSLTANLQRGNRVYITGNRVFTTAYRTTGTWEDNVAVGFAKTMRFVYAVAEAGYLRSPNNSPALATYEGYFFAPRITYRITQTLGLSTGYRIFHSQGGGLPAGDLHFATVSLDWHPGAVRF